MPQILLCRVCIKTKVLVIKSGRRIFASKCRICMGTIGLRAGNGLWISGLDLHFPVILDFMVKLMQLPFNITRKPSVTYILLPPAAFSIEIVKACVPSPETRQVTILDRFMTYPQLTCTAKL